MKRSLAMNLKIKNLTKSFNGEIVLNNINLEINNVHALAIIGPSGGGKTTLLRILAGLEKPDFGEVIVNGVSINFQEEKELIEYRKTVGMVFQGYNLFPHMSAMDNIRIPLEKVHHMENSEAIRIANTLLDKFGLADHINKLPAQLSGGQRQRVAIARALSIEPQFLLLDEPTSALDPSLTKSIVRTIEKLREAKKDLILVTHEISFAKNTCDYFVFIKDGIIADHGLKDLFFSENISDTLNHFLHK